MASSWCLVLLGLVALQGLADGRYATLRDVLSGQRQCPCSDNGGQDASQQILKHLTQSMVSISQGNRLPAPPSGNQAELEEIRRMMAFYAVSQAKLASTPALDFSRTPNQDFAKAQMSADFSRTVASPAFTQGLLTYLDPRPYTSQPRPVPLSHLLLQYLIQSQPATSTESTYQTVSHQVVILIQSLTGHAPSGPTGNAAKALIEFLLSSIVVPLQPQPRPQPQYSVQRYLLMIELVSYLAGAEQPVQPQVNLIQQINSRVIALLHFLSSPGPSSQQTMETKLALFFKSVTTSGPAPRPGPAVPGGDSAKLQRILSFLAFLSHVEQAFKPVIRDPVSQNYKQISVQIVYILETISSPQAGGSGSVNPHVVQKLIRLLTGAPNPGEPSVSPAQQQRVTKELFVYLSSSYTSTGPSTADVSHNMQNKLVSLINFLGQHPQQSTYESTLIFFSQHKTSSPSSSQSTQFMAYLSHVSTSKPAKPSIRPKPVPRPQPSGTYEVVTHKMVFLLESVVKTSSQYPQGSIDYQRITVIRALVAFLSGQPAPGQLPCDPVQKYKLIIRLINYMSGVYDQPTGPAAEVTEMVLLIRKRTLKLVDFLIPRQRDPQQSMVTSLFIFFKQETSSGPQKPSEGSTLKKVLQFLVFLKHVENALKPVNPYEKQIQQSSVKIVFLLEKYTRTSQGTHPSAVHQLIRLLTGSPNPGEPSVSPSQQHKVTKLLFVYLSDVQTGPSQPDVDSQIRDKLKKLVWFLEGPGQNPKQPIYQRVEIFFSHQRVSQPSSSQTTFMLSYLKQVSSQSGPSRPAPYPGRPGGILRPVGPSNVWDDRQYEQTSSTLVFILKKMSSGGPSNNVDPSTVNLLIRLLTGQSIPGEPSVSPSQRRKTTKLLFVYLASESVQSGGSRPQPDIAQEIHIKLIRMIKFLQQPHPQQSTYQRLMIFFSKQQTVGPNPGQSQSILAYFEKITHQSQPQRPKPVLPSWNDDQYHQTSSTLIFILKKMSSEGPSHNVDPSTVNLLISLLTGQSIPGEPSVSPSQRRETVKLLFVYLASESVQSGQPGRQPDIGQEIHLKLIRMIRFLQQPHPQQSTYTRLMIFFSKQQTVGPAPGQSQSIMAYFHKITSTNQPGLRPVPRPRPVPMIPSYINNVNTQQTSTQLVVILKKVSSQQPSGVNPQSLSDLIDILLGRPGISHHQQTKVTKLLLVYLSSSTTQGPSQPGPIDSIINSKLVNLLRYLSGPKQQPQQSTYERLIIFFSKQQTTSSRGPSVTQSKTVLAYLKHTSSTSHPQGPGIRPRPGPGSVHEQSLTVAIAKIVHMLEQPSVVQAVEGSVEVVKKLVLILSHSTTTTVKPSKPKPQPSLQLDSKVVIALIEYLAGVSPSGNVESQIHKRIVKVVAYLNKQKSGGSIEKSLLIFLKKETTINKPAGGYNPSVSVSRILGFLSHIKISSTGSLGPKGPQIDDSALIRALSDSLLAFIRATKPKQPQQSKHVIHIVINVLSDISAKPQPNPSDY